MWKCKKCGSYHILGYCTGVAYFFDKDIAPWDYYADYDFKKFKCDNCKLYGKKIEEIAELDETVDLKEAVERSNIK